MKKVVNQLRSVSSISIRRISCVKICIKGDDFFCLSEAETIFKSVKINLATFLDGKHISNIDHKARSD
jgi:hypothetical protein